MKTGDKVIILKKATKDKRERNLFPLEGAILEINRKKALINTRRGLFECHVTCLKKAKAKKPKTLRQASEAFFESPFGRELLKNCSSVMESNRMRVAFEAGWESRRHKH